MTNFEKKLIYIVKTLVLFERKNMIVGAQDLTVDVEINHSISESLPIESIGIHMVNEVYASLLEADEAMVKKDIPFAGHVSIMRDIACDPDILNLVSFSIIGQGTCINSFEYCNLYSETEGRIIHILQVNHFLKGDDELDKVYSIDLTSLLYGDDKPTPSKIRAEYTKAERKYYKKERKDNGTDKEDAS